LKPSDSFALERNRIAEQEVRDHVFFCLLPTRA